MIKCEHDHLMLVFKQLIVEKNLLSSCANRPHIYIIIKLLILISYVCYLDMPN